MSASNLEILAYEETPLGMLCLRRRQSLQNPTLTVTEITLNQEFLMSSHYTDSERALSNIALSMHGGDDLNVLVGGLGLGYTAYEALLSKQVKSVEVTEYLQQVIAWMAGGLVPLSNELNTDNRVSVVHGDVYAQLAKAPKTKFDVILIDVDHSPDERLDTKCGRFYTRTGLLEAKEHLNDNGILAVWSYASDSPFADALRDVFGKVRVQPITFTHKMLNNEEHTDWLFFARK
ncbi:MAG: spermidine synthase [Lysobacterales bacterium]|jgi:spermidine synthase